MLLRKVGVRGIATGKYDFFFKWLTNIGELFSTDIEWEVVLEGPSVSPKKIGNLTSIGRQVSPLLQ